MAAFAGVFVLGGGLGAWLGTAATTSGEVIVTGSGALGVEAGSGAAALLDPRTWAWNLVFALVGRHGGALLYLAPALVAAIGLRRGEGRGAVVAASVAGLLLALGLAPWSWSGGALPLGPRALVPFAPALLLVLGRPLARSALVLGWVWSAAFVGLFWLAPGRPLVDGEGRAVFPPAPLANWLPLETTQTAVPAGPALDFGAVELRFLAGPAWPGPGPGRFQVLGGREVEILVAARRPVAALDLTLPAEAGFEVELQGAAMGETTFRPDGRVAFTVRLDAPRVRHPTAAAPGGVGFRTFRLRLPTAPMRPLTVAVAVREGAVE
jgi:hypothetical protein